MLSPAGPQSNIAHTMNTSMVYDEPCLDKTRHIRYWTRCLKTLLPHYYTGNESSRMYLAFLTVSALDLLDAWNTVATEKEKAEYVDWIYHCQHPDGGFRMWPGTDFGERATQSNAIWDPANMPATYFALSSLLILGDDLKRVRRKQTLLWLLKMQREDGSFGETFVNGQIEGGKDPRSGYCASGVRCILRGNKAGSLTLDGESIPDINIDKLVSCINLGESYDGGIADEPFHEPHAGYTFCALGALGFVQRLKRPYSSTDTSPVGPPQPHLTLSWLVSLQTDFIDPDEGLKGEFGSTTAAASSAIDSGKDTNNTGVDTLHQSPDKSIIGPPFGPNVSIAGMSGRPSKVADTCYAWWAAASCHMLGHPIYDHQALRRYLLGQTQHSALGGFGKAPDSLPDLYHSYLALATLGLTGTDDVKEVDCMMCISKDAASRLPLIWSSFGT